MWTHKGASCQEVNVRPMRSDSTIQDKELFKPNHLSVDHVSERISPQEEGDEVSDMLSEKVEDYRIDRTVPQKAPHTFVNV